MANAWRSPNLVYRTVEPEDETFICRLNSDSESLLNNDPRLAIPRGKADAKIFQQSSQEVGISGRLVSVLICLPALDNDDKGAPIPIGRIGLFNDGSGNQRSHHRHASLGIFIMKPYQGKGYGTESIKWCLGWAFRMANLHRVELFSMTWNPRAIALYERLGFVHEGRSREKYWFEGAYHDEVVMSMLDREWTERYGPGAARY